MLMVNQMMYVSGETQEPSVDTIMLVESIVRDQVVLMVRPQRISIHSADVQ